MGNLSFISWLCFSLHYFNLKKLWFLTGNTSVKLNFLIYVLFKYFLLHNFMSDVFCLLLHVCLMFSNCQHHWPLWSQRVKQRTEEMNGKAAKRNYARLHMRNTKFIWLVCSDGTSRYHKPSHWHIIIFKLCYPAQLVLK